MLLYLQSYLYLMLTDFKDWNLVLHCIEKVFLNLFNTVWVIEFAIISLIGHEHIVDNFKLFDLLTWA
jgi:hypothetical protein